MLRDILFCGKGIPFNLGTELIWIGSMFGFLKEDEGQKLKGQFVTENGRKLFLLYIYPLINGKTVYYRDENLARQ